MSSQDNSESTAGTGRNDDVERDIFSRAIEIADQRQRRGFLDSACLGNSDLKRRIVELVKRHESESDFIIDRPLFDSEVHNERADEVRESGAVFGDYELVERLGEGGMGEVWLAKQAEPVSRNVAIKLVRTGRETSSVLRRFKAERQALAVLDHPNIARVFDAGATPGGQPFFVMELVQGRPLNEYCDQAKLTVSQRLQIFTQIAQAISHAHQKAILHRDLKPSNVLITEVDGQPIPKVIDFGLAKVMSESNGADPLATRAGDIVGTLEYMAPEQAGYRDQDVDTRADVYSLGVLLYELLTGLRPFDSQRIQAAAIDEALRMVKEEDPAIPSMRLSSSENADSTAQLRRTQVSQLRSQLRNELDWIVMKALEKDRSRRYQSAGEFADDVNRFLCGEPVEAHPPSRRYRVKKFISKNRGLATSVAAVTLVLMAGIAGTSYGFIKANAATELALQEKAAAEAARIQADETREEEARQRRFAVAIGDFLKNDFLRLTSVRSQTHSSELRERAMVDGIVGADATLGDLVDRAATKLQSRTDIEPLVDAEISWILGAFYKNNDDDRRAVPLLKRAMDGYRDELGVQSENYQGARRSLTQSLLGASRLEEAEALIWEAINQLETREDHNARFTALATRDLGELYLAQGETRLAIEMAEKALKLSETVEGYPGDIIMNRFALGRHLCLAGETKRGLPLLKNAVDSLTANYGENFTTTLTAHLTYAKSLRQAGKIDEAITCYEHLIPLMKKTLGPKNTKTLTATSNLATAYSYARRIEDAIKTSREVLEAIQAAYGTDDIRTAKTMLTLGMIYAVNRNFDDAIPLIEEATEIANKVHEPGHANTVIFVDRLAKTYLFAGNPAKAKTTMEQVLAVQIAIRGESHRTTLDTMLRLAGICEKLMDFDRAVELLKRRFELVKRDLGKDHKRTQIYRATYLAALGTQQIAEGKFAEAEKQLRTALEIRRPEAPEDWGTFQYQSKLGEAQLGLKNLDEAKVSLLAAFEAMKKTKQRHPDRIYILNQALDRLIRLAETAEDDSALEQWQAEKMAINSPTKNRPSSKKPAK